MKLLVVGSAGQVGWELQRSLQPLGEVVAVGRQQLDLSAPDRIGAAIDAIKPDVIVNAGAYTAVDKAESDVETARRVNAQAPGELAKAARRHGALMIHYSTDYVFDGTKADAYREDDPTCPVNAYGLTKLEGEQAMAAAGGDWLVFRTTWVFASRGGNFARTMLRLAGERETLSVVNDQFGAPTSARFIADATAQIVALAQAERRSQRFASGIYNLSAAGRTSWHGYACELFAGARARGQQLKVGEVGGIPAAQYPTPARRPANSVLSHDRLIERFGIRPPAWQTGVGLVLDELFGR